MPPLLLSATSVDREVRIEADDAVNNLIAHAAYQAAEITRLKAVIAAMREKYSPEAIEAVAYRVAHDVLDNSRWSGPVGNANIIGQRIAAALSREPTSIVGEGNE